MSEEILLDVGVQLSPPPSAPPLSPAPSTPLSTTDPIVGLIGVAMGATSESCDISCSESVLADPTAIVITVDTSPHLGYYRSDVDSGDAADAADQDGADDDDEEPQLITLTTVDSENRPPIDYCDNDHSFHFHHRHHQHRPRYHRSPNHQQHPLSSFPPHHHAHHYQHLTIDPEADRSNSLESPSSITILHHLPLSPSMTPPIVLSPAGSPSSSSQDSDDTSDTEAIEHPELSEATNPDHALQSDHDQHQPDQLDLGDGSRTPSPQLNRSRSLRGSQRSSQRFSPYHRSLPSSPRPPPPYHQGVLRPINGSFNDRLRTDRSSPDQSSCDSITNSTNNTALNNVTTTIDHSSDLEDSQPSETTKSVTSPVPVHHHQQHLLHIDTHLANSQSAAAQHESRAAKTALARKIHSVIQADDFDNFLAILRQQKPDLNVFIDGQTALHTCLLLGRDVSWCKQLVQYGANPTLSNQDGWNPLHLAAFGGLNEILNYLASCNSISTHRGGSNGEHAHHHHHSHHLNSSHTHHHQSSSPSPVFNASSASQRN